MNVHYYEVSPAGSKGLTAEAKTASFGDRRAALAFARRCWNSEGDLALDDEWLAALPEADRAFVEGP